MDANKSQLVIIFFEIFQEIINPICSNLEIIENKIGKVKPRTTSYYRNKDLNNIYGLSDNTILKYLSKSILLYIPYIKQNVIDFLKRRDSG